MIGQLYKGGGFISKQEFMTKTLTFIANSVFINLFAKAFGMSNSIVAVSIVVIALTLVTIDLRENIFRKTIYLSIIMVGLGISATLINSHPILGLVINIPVVFLIVYEGVNSYKENMYFPFLLSYIFMALSAPASLVQLPTRIVAIIVGCMYILVIQLVLNRDRFNKTVFYTKKQLISRVIYKIDALLGKKESSIQEQSIHHLMKPIIKAIYDTRLKGKNISTKNRGILLLALSIEELYDKIETISRPTLEETELLLKVKALLQKVEIYFYGEEEATQLKKEMLMLIKEIEAYTNDRDLAASMKAIVSAIQYMESKDEKEPFDIVHLKNGLKPIDVTLSSFKFAAKLSLALSLIIFLVDVFNITYGRWIIFPMIAIIQPYSDGTLKKSIERVLGTLLGIILFSVIFAVIKDNIARLNITIVLAYINLFMKKYYISTSLVAVSALASVVIGGAGAEVILWRVVFTIMGCVLGLVINRCIYAYTLKDYIEEIVEEYNKALHILDHLEHVPQNAAKIYDNILKIKLMDYLLAEHNKSRSRELNSKIRNLQHLILGIKITPL